MIFASSLGILIAKLGIAPGIMGARSPYPEGTSWKPMKSPTEVKVEAMNEYRMVPSAGLPSADQHNKLATDGWEVIQIVENHTSRERYEYAVYLRRRVTVN